MMGIINNVNYSSGKKTATKWRVSQDDRSLSPQNFFVFDECAITIKISFCYQDTEM